MKLGRKVKTEQYGGIRRDYKFPNFNRWFYVHLHLGRNTKACALGHWFAGNGICRCGKPVKHSGFYADHFYGMAGLDIYFLGLQMHSWINNEIGRGSYYKVGKYILGLYSRGWYGAQFRKSDIRGSLINFERSRPYD